MKINEITEAIDDPESAKEHTKSLPQPELIQFIKTNCSDAWEGLSKGHYICKGFRHKTDPGYLTDSSQIMRSSQNTANFYTEFTSKYSKNWKSLPPRNRSLICSSNISTARGYSGRSVSPYYVFPVNGIQIGICPELDFWDSFFNSNIASMGDFADNMNIIMHGINVYNVEGFLNMIIPQDGDKYFWQELYPFKGQTVYDAVEQIMDPWKNKFKVRTTQRYYENSFPDNEVWFSGKAALIRADLINDV